MSAITNTWRIGLARSWSYWIALLSVSHLLPFPGCIGSFTSLCTSLYPSPITLRIETHGSEFPLPPPQQDGLPPYPSFPASLMYKEKPSLPGLKPWLSSLLLQPELYNWIHLFPTHTHFWIYGPSVSLCTSIWTRAASHIWPLLSVLPTVPQGVFTVSPGHRGLFSLWSCFTSL